MHRRHRQGLARPQARERAVDLLDKVGIASPAERLGQYPHQLSGGLRQRVMIAMALMCEPELLIADEPTTALDVTIQAQILRLLADLRRELGIALLLITHDLGVVARIADRVNVMYAGEIVESATAADLFADPRHPYTRGLLACLPRPGVTARRRAARHHSGHRAVADRRHRRLRLPLALPASRCRPAQTSVPEREARRRPSLRAACTRRLPEGVPA